MNSTPSMPADHAVDGVAAAAAYADDLDLGVVSGFLVKADANVVLVHVFHCSLGMQNPLTTKGTKVHEGSLAIPLCTFVSFVVRASSCSLSYQHRFQSRASNTRINQ